MKNLKSKIIIGGISLISLLLIIWLGASYYLYTQASTIVYEYSRSKDLKFEVPSIDKKILKLDNGEQIGLQIVPNSNTDKYILYLAGNWGPLPPIVKDLSKYANVAFVYYPGYGESNGKSNTNLVNQSAEKALNYLQNQGIANNQITVFGHSLGGSPSLYLASKYSDLNQVIVVNSFYSIQKMCELQYSILCVFAGDVHPSYKYAREAKSNILHFHSPTDEFIPFKQGQLLDKEIKSKHEFIEISGSHGEPKIDEIMSKIQERDETKDIFK
jgi:hypothetical protein